MASWSTSKRPLLLPLHPMRPTRALRLSSTSHFVSFFIYSDLIMSYSYQSIESKRCPTAVVLGATAVLSVSVGAVVGLLASSQTSELYVPTTTSQTTANTVAVASQESAALLQANKYSDVSAPVEEAEQGVFTTPQATFSWGPVAALIAVPTAIATYLLRKSEGQKLAAAGMVASAIMTSQALAPVPAYAAESINGLTPCAESKQFAKNLKKEVKALEKREKLYEAGSAPFLALEQTKARTEARFAKYAAQGLLCGDDGLPHLIADPGLAVRYGHAGEVFIPTFGFLYIAGYIGHAGRTYLKEISGRQKPTQSEIIIDVPLASSIAFKSWDWPRQAFQELASGQLLEKEENVPVSRR